AGLADLGAGDEPLDAARQGRDDRVPLQAGQPLAGAAVRPVAERQMVDGVALDQEGVRVLVVARVAVAGAEKDRDLRALRDEDAVDLDVAGGAASPGVDRRPVAEDLTERG